VTRVKICGLTTVDDVRCAAEAGADFLGFVLYRNSPRFVSPERVATMVRVLRQEFGECNPRSVGVLVDESVESTRAILAGTGLHLVQLHGAESPQQLQALAPRAFKAARPRTRPEAEALVVAYRSAWATDPALPQLLVDAYHPHQLGGTGRSARLPVARWLACRCRLALAGGLRPETVGEAIREVRPWCVDVSSGVERAKGVKDPSRVRAFIAAVREVDAELKMGRTGYGS